MMFKLMFKASDKEFVRRWSGNGLGACMNAWQNLNHLHIIPYSHEQRPWALVARWGIEASQVDEEEREANTNILADLLLNLMVFELLAFMGFLVGSPSKYRVSAFNKHKRLSGTLVGGRCARWIGLAFKMDF